MAAFPLCLYDGILRDPSGIALVSKSDAQITGFVAGTAEPQGFYRRLLLRRWYRVALVSVLPTLRNPDIILGLLGAFGKAGQEPVPEASRRRLFFEEQLKSEEESLIGAEIAFQQVQLKKGLVHLDAQTNVIIGSLAALRGQIAAKEVELQALRSYSTEHNSEVQLAERELSAMQGEAAQMEQHSQTNGYSDIGLKDVPKAGLDYIRAERELQYQQSLFDMLLRQYEAAKLDEAKEAATIQVVEPAIPPDKKSSPHRAQILLLFTALGFLSACSYLYLSDLVQRNSDIAQSLAELRVALFSR